MMQQRHQLALPLPAAYAHDACDEMSYFATTTTTTTTKDNTHDCNDGEVHYAAVDRYVDDLCAFLRRTRLVQNHPEHFFEYAACTSSSLSSSLSSSSALLLPAHDTACAPHAAAHDTTPSFASPLDMTGVTVAEVAQTMRLCRAFVPLITDEAFSAMRTLVRNGPPQPRNSQDNNSNGPDNNTTTSDEDDNNDAAALRAFYEQTQALALHRRLRAGRHGVCRTLCLRATARDQHAHACSHCTRRRRVAATADDDMDEVACGGGGDGDGGSSDEEQHNSTADDDDDDAASRTAQIMRIVLGHGMSVKKQHEVTRMRQTVCDVVRLCNTPPPCTCQARHTRTTTTATATSTSTSTTTSVPVDTVVNVGEGKGYVSRALALCDALQVIGLDCNPQHKQRALDRVEALLEGGLAASVHAPRSNNNNNNSTSHLRQRQEQGERDEDKDNHAAAAAVVASSASTRTQTAQPVNLLYEPRGHMTSIVCRVSDDVDWAALLRSHVPVREDDDDDGGDDDDKDDEGRARMTSTTNCDDGGGAHNNSTATATRDTPTHTNDDKNDDDDDNVFAQRTSRKARCRWCGSWVRLSSPATVLKHVYRHLRDTHVSDERTHNNNEAAAAAARDDVVVYGDGGDDQDVIAQLPTLATVEAWNVQLSPAACARRVLRAFYVIDDEARRLCRNNNKNNAEREDHVEHDDDDDDMSAPRRVSPPIARGFRVEVVYATRHWCAAAAAHEQPRRRGGDEDGATAWTAVCDVATVLGYDDATQRHRIRLDTNKHDSSSSNEVYYALYTCTLSTLRCTCGDGAVASAHGRMSPQQHTAQHDDDDDVACPLRRWCVQYVQAAARVYGEQRYALVHRILPLQQPAMRCVRVPSLRNCVLVGLHPCGDLGATLCRLFVRSAAAGMVLVSCCWHAVTAASFPRSRALRRRGVTLSSVSLQLATQPPDMWATASPHGHRASARLLFFRSLLKLLWTRLAAHWAVWQREEQAHEQCVSRCTREDEGRVGCCFCAAMRGAAPAAPSTSSSSRASCPADDTTHAAARDDVVAATATAACRVCCDAQLRCRFVPVPHLEPAFLRRIALEKATMTFTRFVEAVAQEYVYTATAKQTAYTRHADVCARCRAAQEALLRCALCHTDEVRRLGDDVVAAHFSSFLGFTVLRMWMCHLAETLLLLDRVLYVHEQLVCARRVGGGADDDGGGATAVSLVPLFDGAVSPRMYGILARRMT